MPLAMATETPTAPMPNERIAVTDSASADFQPAPLWKRFLAYSVDLGIVGAVMYLALLVGFAVIGGAAAGSALGGAFKENGPLLTGAAIGLMALVFLCTLAILSIYHGYFVYFEYKTGQTPGKKLFGLRVVTTRSDPITLGQVVMRDFFRYIDCGLILPGLISMAVTERRQRIGDLASSTLVIYSRRGEEKQHFLYVKQEDFEPLRELLQPLPVPGDVRHQFLYVAYPIFILGQKPTHPEDLWPWEELARSYLSGEKAKEFDQTTVLMFFAEHCFQSHES